MTTVLEKPASPLAANTFAADPRLSDLLIWLATESQRSHDNGTMLEDLCRQIVAIGVPVTRATTHMRALHSERIGVTHRWIAGHHVEELFFPHGARQSTLYNESPVRLVHETLEWVELRPGEADQPPLNILADLRAGGITHYLMGPLRFRDGIVNAISFATDRAKGFSSKDVAFLKAATQAAAPYLELPMVHRTLEELLKIYVGREPGSRILSGQTQRGDVQRIRSAILFCDMRGFTHLSTQLDEAETVTLLNEYFDCVFPAVEAAGGEILKLVGDGVLAIFHEAEEGCPMAANQALEAAQAILAAIKARNARKPEQKIKVGIGLHIGWAAFGNIGAGERLDFTVVGRDVNLASRIADLTKYLAEPLLVSEGFAKRALCNDAQFEDLGRFQLKGFERWQPVLRPVTG